MAITLGYDVFFASLFVLMNIVICIAAGFWPIRKFNAFSLENMLISLALLPSAISLWCTVVFALTSYAFPTRVIFYLGPTLAFVYSLSIVIRRLSFSNVYIPLSVYFHSCYLSLYYAQIWTIFIEGTRIRFDHDISLYFKEVASVVLRCVKVLQIPCWLSFRDPAIFHPHSLSFSHYLAWGFLSDANPGFGSDLGPRFLLALNQVAFVSALIVTPILIIRKFSIVSLLPLLLFVFDRSWHYQIGNAARDLFFITPFIILIAKLIMSQPSQSRFHNAIVLAICVWGVLTGHSLGLVYITPIIATVIIFKFLEFKKKLVGILEI